MNEQLEKTIQAAEMLRDDMQELISKSSALAAVILFDELGKVAEVVTKLQQIKSAE